MYLTNFLLHGLIFIRNYGCLTETSRERIKKLTKVLEFGNVNDQEVLILRMLEGKCSVLSVIHAINECSSFATVTLIASIHH